MVIFYSPVGTTPSALRPCRAIILIAALAVALLSLSACAPADNGETDARDTRQDTETQTASQSTDTSAATPDAAPSESATPDMASNTSEEIYPVGRITTIELQRRVRGALLLRVTYPIAEGVFPVVIFSHGALGSKDGYDPLINFWASRGFVCIQPTHGDSLSFIPEDQRRRYNNVREVLADPQVLRHWRTRPEDISLAIDWLNEIEAQLTEHGVQIARDQIAVAGHSFGAHSAQLIGGMTVNTARGQRLTMFDSRVKAIIAISPQGEGVMLDARSWETLERPTLMITGSNDASPLHDRDPSWRLDAFRHAPPGDRYLLYIEDAYHGFGGIAGTLSFETAGPERPGEVQTIQRVTFDFLRAFLLEDAAARDRLDRGAVPHVDGVEARLTRKE